jgi:hypothetical protein
VGAPAAAGKVLAAVLGGPAGAAVVHVKVYTSAKLANSHFSVSNPSFVCFYLVALGVRRRARSSLTKIRPIANIGSRGERRFSEFFFSGAPAPLSFVVLIRLSALSRDLESGRGADKIVIFVVLV